MRLRRLRFFALFLSSIVIAATSVIIPQQASAIDQPKNCAILVDGVCKDQDYINFKINHYDPSFCGGATSGDNEDYAGRPILNEAQLSAITTNKPFYEKAATASHIPWQMIAVIHLRETGLKRLNPSNGQGIYQNSAATPGEYPDSKGKPVSDAEFQKQTNWAAQFIKGKSKNPVALASGNAGEIKDTFFGYNGRSSQYAAQAKSLGFTNAYDGSPYVMNIADEKRDPKVNGDKWGQIKADGGQIEYPANSDYGAFVVYQALGGATPGEDCSDISGTLRQKVVKLAEEELEKWESNKMTPGFRAGNDNSFSKYTYDISGNWCAWFVSWILKEAGSPVNKSKQPYWSVVSQFSIQGPSEKGFKVHPRGDGYKPKPGDLAIYNGKSHINIVVGYDDAGRMLTIGGNQGSYNYQQSRVSRNIGYGSSATSYISID